MNIENETEITLTYPEKVTLCTEEELHDNLQETKSLQLPALVIMQAACPVHAEPSHVLCLTFLLHKKGVKASFFF